MYIRCLRHIFIRAIDNNDIERKYYPFGNKKYQIPAKTKVKKALSIDQLRILFEAKTISEQQKKAKDFWFFLYACSGINVKDLAYFKYKDIDNDKVIFLRAKTIRTKKRKLKPIIVYLNEFSKGIIYKYGNQENDPENYVFDILTNKDSAEEQSRKIKNFTHFLNDHIKKICIANDISGKISSNWARHSYATNIMKKTKNILFASESLGHSDIRQTMDYFAGFEDEEIKELSKSIMDFGSKSEE